MRVKVPQDVAQLTSWEQLQRYVAITFAELIPVVNGRLSFGDNIESNSISVVFNSTNTDVTIAHTLGRLPLGYLVKGRSAAMVIYDGSIASTNSAITLRSDTAGTAQIIVF